jgi:putative DNA primase/helicase
MNETREGEKLDEPTVKDITGGDTISARFLYKEAFDFIPAFKLWMRGNHKPAINGMDDGIWRRIHLIPFLRQFKGAEKDTQIGLKLLNELDGILAWSVRGCFKYRKQGLNPPSKVTDAVKEYREDSDLLGQFIEEKCLVRDDLKTPCRSLQENFLKWAGQDTELNNRTFTPAMANKGFVKSKRTSDCYYFLGIAPKPDESYETVNNSVYLSIITPLMGRIDNYGSQSTTSNRTGSCQRH